MWQRILAAAFAAIESGQGNQDYCDGLVKTGEFFIQRLLPRSRALVEEIAAGPEALMALRAEQFLAISTSMLDHPVYVVGEQRLVLLEVFIVLTHQHHIAFAHRYHNAIETFRRENCTRC